MKFKFLIPIFLAIGLIITMTYQSVIGDYHFENRYLQNWNLADKSSSLAAKQEHIEAFVQTLTDGYTEGQFSQYDAIYLQTPNNNFEKNLIALQTLSQRLKEIQTMTLILFNIKLQSSKSHSKKWAKHNL